MLVYLSEWLSLIIRWFHVIAGVAWIGASFYFVWLDNNLREPPAWKRGGERAWYRSSIDFRGRKICYRRRANFALPVTVCKSDG